MPAVLRCVCCRVQRNGELRVKILGGEVLPAQLVSMTPAQLATAEQQEQYAKMHVDSLRRVTLDASDSAGLANGIACKECGSMACDVLQSGRRDIGKSETWGAKDREGRGRTVHCLSCGHRWEVDELVMP
ncbi:MAG: hypothetical protein WDW36_006838 [Sanguina aurantia]